MTTFTEVLDLVTFERIGLLLLMLLSKFISLLITIDVNKTHENLIRYYMTYYLRNPLFARDNAK